MMRGLMYGKTFTQLICSQLGSTRWYIDTILLHNTKQYKREGSPGQKVGFPVSRKLIFIWCSLRCPPPAKYIVQDWSRSPWDPRRSLGDPDQILTDHRPIPSNPNLIWLIPGRSCLILPGVIRSGPIWDQSGPTGDFKSPENVWIQMFHRRTLSVLLKSKKLFGEGDVGYAKILETRQILNEGDCKGWQSVKSRINVFMKIREIDT